MSKNVTGVLTHPKSTFLDAQSLGTKGWYPLKMLQVLENDQGLLVHAPPEVGLSSLFCSLWGGCVDFETTAWAQCATPTDLKINRTSKRRNQWILLRVSSERV